MRTPPIEKPKVCIRCGNNLLVTNRFGQVNEECKRPKCVLVIYLTFFIYFNIILFVIPSFFGQGLLLLMLFWFFFGGMVFTVMPLPFLTLIFPLTLYWLLRQSRFKDSSD
jgi:hypothetical protein